MAELNQAEAAGEDASPVIPHTEPLAGTGSLEAGVSREPNPLKRAVKVLGPGLITGASDDDPSGIGTYATTGAAFGYATLWTALLTFPLMAAVQYSCAKVGLVSGEGLAGVLRRHYPRGILYPVLIGLLIGLLIANTLNAGADLGAIAAGVNLLLPIPITAMIIPSGVVILALQLWGSYRLIARIFKWLTLALFAYIGAAFFAHPAWRAVLRGTFVPTIQLNASYLATLVALLGTTISPYLFFWQASQEVEEQVSLGRVRLWQRRGASDAELHYAAWDVNLGMLLSNLVMYFIILTTAATLHAAGKTSINSATEAAQALRPLAGQGAEWLLAFGLIGAGFLAVPILTGSGAYAAAEAFGWRYGLDRRPGRAKPFYAVIVGSTLVGMLLNFVGINPIDALFWSAVVNGLVAPPVLVLVMRVANNRQVMGERTNSRLTNSLGWVATIAMFAAAIGLFVTWG